VLSVLDLLDERVFTPERITAIRVGLG